MRISIQDVDIKLLRIFHTIVQCGGFSLAQARLNVSQSSISTQMSKLETRLGVRLCERGHSMFRLTPEGEQVLRATERLLSAIDDFRSELSEAQGLPRGELRIGLMDNMVTNPNSPLSSVFGEVSAAAPNIHFNIYIGGMVALGERVLDSRLPFALGFAHRRIAGLSYTPLFDEKHFLYCGREHPFFHRRPEVLDLNEIAEADFAGYGTAELASGNPLPFAPREVASSPYMEGLVYLVLSGRYLAFLPSHYAKRWVDTGEMRAIRTDLARTLAQFYLITRENEPQPLIVRFFLDHLRAKTSGEHGFQCAAADKGLLRALSFPNSKSEHCAL